MRYLMPNPAFLYVLNILFAKTFCRYTQLINQTIQFQIIQFGMGYLVALSLKVKQFFLNHRQDPSGYFHLGSDCNLEQWQWMSTPYFHKFQHYWNLPFRLFSVISRTLFGGGGLTFLQGCSRCVLQPQLIGLDNLMTYSRHCLGGV